VETRYNYIGGRYGRSIPETIQRLQTGESNLFIYASEEIKPELQEIARVVAQEIQAEEISGTIGETENVRGAV
jgi:hypothetical protein